MNKLIIIFTFSLLCFNSVAQDINEEISYWKSVNYLLVISDISNDLYIEQSQERKDYQLPHLECLLENLNIELSKLETNYSSDSIFIEINEIATKAVEGIKSIKSDDWLKYKLWYMSMEFVGIDSDYIILDNLCKKSR